MTFPDPSAVALIRESYPPGLRVRLLRMDDPQAPPVGTLGVVRGVDDTGSVMVSWETGGSLNVVYGADLCAPVITAERREEILSCALEYIIDAAGHNDLYPTLHGCIVLTDEEILALGIGVDHT